MGFTHFATPVQQVSSPIDAQAMLASGYTTPEIPNSNHLAWLACSEHFKEDSA
jgi:hypothetical protein